MPPEIPHAAASTAADLPAEVAVEPRGGAARPRVGPRPNRILHRLVGVGLAAMMAVLVLPAALLGSGGYAGSGQLAALLAVGGATALATLTAALADAFALASGSAGPRTTVALAAELAVLVAALGTLLVAVR
jgi:hypothetical protein